MKRMATRANWRRLKRLLHGMKNKITIKKLYRPGLLNFCFYFLPKEAFNSFTEEYVRFRIPASQLTKARGLVFNCLHKRLSIILLYFIFLPSIYISSLATLKGAGGSRKVTWEISVMLWRQGRVLCLQSGDENFRTRDHAHLSLTWLQLFILTAKYGSLRRYTPNGAQL